MENPEDYRESTFRDRPTTFSKEGKRLWLFPKMPKGKLYNIRRVIAWALLAFFYLAPFLKFRGEPLVFLNFLERKFVLFGSTFYPQDFYLLVLAVIALVVFIVLFTVIYGRIFCGWVCPQTVFLEFLYRPIEYLIDGDSSEQQKLANQEMDATKMLKRILKHGIYLIISFFTILTFMAYVIGTGEVGQMLKGWPLEGFGILMGVWAFTGAHYFVFAWFREQVCTMVCPYGRLQGVMLDVNTILVAYDYKRGEPRGRGEKGDCINCRKCVAVCPTGIDIRNGTQLECINCTACIDACNSVMSVINKPTGLIRFASEKSISEGKKVKFNARVIAYSAVLFSLLVLITYLFTVRGSFETHIIRAQGTMFQEYGPDSYSNLYNLELVNKTNSDVKVALKLLFPEGEILVMGDSLKAGKGEVAQRNLLIVLKKSDVKSSNNHLEIGVYEAGKLINTISSTFVGPNSLDK
ncbi:type cbb3 cytochrome oxidase biogenesis protein CcoG [Aquipluma nitroreducens]|uniref:Type cbb3 cytochrome oxidase biogenesis protein CcoG n=1 Tax=Aquipluma nitroreducens TaxID=2010828 RepID=A0A5K7S317_9BACT|nr:cytochrome c oxidase accessory protein CcoG [Aquipluma nitroreducens]BBE15958.1 type cbb3 cytochrome oxidase biogenesis protein CcoG [Aquipluma nitroreducens]